MSPAARRRLGIAALIATAALWGSNHVVARAVRETVPLPALVFWRWLLGAGILTIIAWPSLRRAWPAVRPRLAELIVGGAVGVGLFSYFLLGGAYQSLALEVGFINATTPVWVALLSLAGGGERLSARGWTGLALALLGTLAIIAKGDPAALAQLRFSIGNLWSLLGAMTFAWFSLRVRAWSVAIEALPITLITAWAGLILVMLPVYVASLAMGGAWFVQEGADPAVAAAAIGFIGLGPTMLGNLFFLFGIATIGPARAAAFIYLSPVFSAVLAMGWLGEEMAWFHAAGFAAIVLGLVLLTRRPGGAA